MRFPEVTRLRDTDSGPEPIAPWCCMQACVPCHQKRVAASLLYVTAAWAALCLLVAPSPAVQTDGTFTIDVELATDPVVPKGLVLNWVRLLREAGAASVRQVGRLRPDAPVIEPAGKQRLTVRAVLLRNGSLRIGKATVRPGDREGLRKLLAQIRAEGPLVFAPKTERWNLPEPLFVQVFGELSIPAQFEYEEVLVSKLLDDVRDRINLPIIVSEDAKPAVQERSVAVVLKSVSLGTALAHVLGSVGLGFEPRRTGPSTVALVVGQARALKDPWPIGWKATEPPGRLVPRLFERVTIPPRRLPVMQLIASLAVHCRVPFLVDHVALARKGIDIADVMVDVGCRNRALVLCFKDALRPASLSYAVKVDEGGRPLVVIQPLVQFQRFPSK